MKTMSISGITRSTLSDVCEVRAVLVNGLKPLIAHRHPIVTVGDGPGVLSQCAEITGNNREPFQNIEEAFEEFSKQIEQVGADDFAHRPGPKATEFLKALSSIHKNLDSFTPEQVIQAGSSVELHGSKLEEVITELSRESDFQCIDRGDNGYITLNRFNARHYIQM